MRKSAPYFKLLFALSLSAALFSTITAHAVPATRFDRPQIRETLAGALIYLDDMQIRSRPGKGSCFNDASSGDGCLWTFKVRNLVGEWASRIFLLPNMAGELSEEDRYPVQDSNLFTTAGVAYPLAFISDRSSTQTVSQMKNLALGEMELFRKGDAYNFWITIPGRTSSQPVVGPMNLSPKTLKNLFSIFDNVIFRAIITMIVGKHSNGDSWEKQIGDPKINPYGMDSAFNIPNDADDSSMAVALAKIYSPEAAVDLAPLDRISSHRDLNREKRDKRNDWIKKDSGLFLTWLKDDTLPPFADPTTGTIPLGVNNVDCVVNQNVLLAMGLTGTATPEITQSVGQFALETVKQKKWPKCGLYYPQEMMFPYTASRAFRDGQVKTPEMTLAMEELLKAILQPSLQKRDGSFSGGADGTRDLATALAATTLLNIGRETAERLQLTARYDQVLEKSIKYLTEHRIDHETRGTRDGLGYKWAPGVFFSASGWSIATWKSEAYTVAITLEALTKYALEYDRTNETVLTARKISVRRWDNKPRVLASELVIE